MFDFYLGLIHDTWIWAEYIQDLYINPLHKYDITLKEVPGKSSGGSSTDGYSAFLCSTAAAQRMSKDKNSNI